MSILVSFWKPEACGQTVLPDMSLLIGQKLVKNAKIKKSNATFWVLKCMSHPFGQLETLDIIIGQCWTELDNLEIMTSDERVKRA